MSELVRIDQNNGLPPKIVKDYISIVDGRRVMFDKLTNLEVNTENWSKIASARNIK